MMWFVFVSAASAQDIQVNGDIKNFFITGFPYEHLLMIEDDYAQSFLDTRLKVKVKATPNLRFVAHHVVTMGSISPQTNISRELALLGQELDDEMSSGFMTGVGLQAPEAITLSWNAFEDSMLMMQGR